MRRAVEALALTWPYGLLRDRHFLLAAGAGPLFLAALWVLTPAHPTDPARLFSWPYLYLTVIAPVMEELAFRGALQGWLLDYRWGRQGWGGLSAANLTVSVLFMAIHFAYHPPLWALAVLFPSLVFGHLRDRTGSVVPGMLLHAWYNAGYFALAGLPGG